MRDPIAASFLPRDSADADPAPRLMGILNVTPDSFSDGGSFMAPTRAVEHALRMVEEGATIVDIGGESTRPGAAAVPAPAQIERVAPVIALLAAQRPAGAQWSISIDTTSASVAEAAIAAGATIVNDVSAGLDDPRILEVAARRSVAVVLMHRRSAPAQDSYSDRYAVPPQYGDVVGEVVAFLLARVEAAVAAGIPRGRIAIDPGLGFGKSVAQNYELLARLPALVQAHPCVLVGASRKSFLGAASGTAGAADRLAESLAAATIAVLGGASILRVHDVEPTRRAVAVARRVRR